jgi:hypothetical protein
MIKIYCDLDFFESIQFSDEENNFLLKIFKLEVELYLGITSEALLSLQKNEESFLSRFLKSNNLTAPKSFEFENDEWNTDSLKNAGISIAFTKHKNENIENKRGILIINNLDECVLHFKGGYITNITSKNNFNWDKAIFKGNTYPKWTSVLISDNYLFKDLNGGSKLGFYNLKKFFTNFLPKKSSEKIHITIVSSNSIYQNRGWTFVKSKSEWDNEFEIFKQSIKEINPDLEINIELFLTRKTIHKRVLITDFTYGWCDKGFKIYDLNNRINEDNENDFHYYNLFHNIQDYGDIFYNLAIENLRDIKKIIQEKIFISKDNDDFELFFGEVDRLNKCSKNPLILYEKVQN